jgi:hypothetical protein
MLGAVHRYSPVWWGCTEVSSQLPAQNQRLFIKRYNLRILTTTFELIFKLLRYSWAFRERAWPGRAHRHRQLATHNTEKTCFQEVSLHLILASVAVVCFFILTMVA